MYQCKYLNMLPLQSFMDVATTEGDTVLIPERRFEQMFGGEFIGGVLGIRLRCGDTVLYGGCAPQVDDEYAIYLPDWMMETLREKTMNFDELMADVEAAGDIEGAATLYVRRIDDELEADIQELLQKFLFDCKYIHANTVLHLPFAGTVIDVIVERVMNEAGDPIEVGRLGAEVNLEIEEPLIAPPRPAFLLPDPPRPASPPPPKPVTPPPSAEELRRRRLAYFESRGNGPANVPNGGGQQPSAQ